MATSDDILGFWFGELDQAAEPTDAMVEKETMKWFRRNAEFDQLIETKYRADVDSAARGDYDGWSSSARGRLALVVLLDQFPRNIFRDSPRAFASDARALAVTRAGIDAGVERELNLMQRFMFYMPLMHSESLEIQRLSVERFQKLRDEDPSLADACSYAERHCEIIERFGRYPHRNRVLSRESTPEELLFLKEPKSSF